VSGDTFINPDPPLLPLEKLPEDEDAPYDLDAAPLFCLLVSD